MSSLAVLRQLINDRLASVADDIFGMFEKTVLAYEEELERQRKLLDAVFASSSKLPQREPQPLPALKAAPQAVPPDQEEVVLRPHPPRNDAAVVCQKPGLKQEISHFLLVPAGEESPSEGGLQDCGPGEPPAGQQCSFNKSTQSCVEDQRKCERHSHLSSPEEMSRDYNTKVDDKSGFTEEQQLSEIPDKNFLLISSCEGNFNIESRILDSFPVAVSADESALQNAPSQSSVAETNRHEHSDPAAESHKTVGNGGSDEEPKPHRNLDGEDSFAMDADDSKSSDSSSTCRTFRKSKLRDKIQSHNANSLCSCSTCTEYFTSCHVLVKHISIERKDASSTLQKYKRIRYASEMLRCKMSNACLKTPPKSSKPRCPYSCDICGKSYNRHSTLNRHLKSQMHIINSKRKIHRRTAGNKTS